MSEHDDLTLRCSAETDEVNEYGNPELCGTKLVYAEHGSYVQHLGAKQDRRGTPLRDRFEMSALRFDCPECGTTHYQCPVCSGDSGAPGWYRGDSTGEMLACHNCNTEEYARQRGAPF